MMKPILKRTLAIAAALAVSVTAACSNDPGTTVTPCPAIALAQPTLLYPKPGAIGVPTTVRIVILANISSFGGSVTLATTGSTVAAGTFGPAPSPLPAGSATPPPGTTAQAASIPTLFAGSVYAVNFVGNSVAGSLCAAPQSGGTLGAFST